MGTGDFRFGGFLSSLFIFPAYEARLFLNVCGNPFLHLYENNKASETKPEKQAKNAPAIVYVNFR